MIKYQPSITGNAGSLCERGIINSFDRQGFTLVKCGSELIANSIDAGSSNIIFTTDGQHYIKIIDDGCGMTPEKLKKMVEIYGENHSNHKSMGVSGMGFSAASLKWSKAKDTTPKKIYVYTKNQNKQHLKACIPWDKICLQGIFTGQVEISAMTSDESNEFILERTSNGLRMIGTTIVVPYSENISELLDEQFLKGIQCFENLKDSWSIVFGKNHQRISYNDGINNYELSKYDYFGGSDEEFYCGKFYTEIYNFMDEQGNCRFVCKNPYTPKPDCIYMEFKKIGKGFSTKAEEVEISSGKISDSDIIHFVSGMRKCVKIFDENDPKDVSATYHVNDYDEKFSNNIEDYKKFCGQISIFRNNQRITGFIPEGYNVSSARADGKQRIKYNYHRVSLSYETMSKQNNPIDEVHGIQQNKNQNQNDFPKNYQRLVKYLKEYHLTEIQNYIDSFISEPDPEHKLELELELEPEPEPESKLESKPESKIKSELESKPESKIKSEPEPEPELEFKLESKPESKPESKLESKIKYEPEPEQSNYENKRNEIEESKSWLIDAAKLIMETTTDPNYTKTNGNDIYNLIKSMLNK